MKKIFLLLILYFPQVFANHLGTYGTTFEIIEKDLLEEIEGKLRNLEKNGGLAKHQTEIQEKTTKKLQNPKKVEGIVRTQKPRDFTFDPSITAPYDLRDHTGKVFVKAGTKVNPLDTVQLKKPLLFIDGEDNAQVQWALAQSSSKIILVKGSPFVLMDLYSIPFYFDQSGHLVKRFGLQQVPARISQLSKLLKIEEIELKGECN